MESWAKLFESLGVSAVVILGLAAAIALSLRWTAKEIFIPLRDRVIGSVLDFFAGLTVALDKVTESVDKMSEAQDKMADSQQHHAKALDIHARALERIEANTRRCEQNRRGPRKEGP